MQYPSPPKLLKINVTSLIPLPDYGLPPYSEQPWVFNATFTVFPQLHSDNTTPRAGIYNGLDVLVGDYITTQMSKVLKIVSITFQDNDTVECVVEDDMRLNASTDMNQTGESAMQTGSGLLFTAINQIPIFYPLPGDLGNFQAHDLVEIQSRFFYAYKINQGSDSKVLSLLEQEITRAEGVEASIQQLVALKANIADLSKVAFSGDYDDLTNKPFIPVVPTNISAFLNDVGYQTESQVEAEIDAYETAHPDKGSGGNASFKVFTFPAALEWTVQHNMNTKFFIETITDSNGTRVYTQVNPVDNNVFTVTFTQATAGSVSVYFPTV